MTGPTLLGVRLSVVRPVMVTLFLLVALLGCLGAVWESLEQSRANVEDRLRDAMSSTVFSLDMQLSNAKLAAMTLAASPRFQMDPSAMGPLRDHAKAIAQMMGGWAAATSPDDPDATLFDTRDAPAAAAGCDANDQALRSAFREVRETHQPVITEMFVNPRDCRPGAAVVAPVLRGDSLIRMVIFSIALDRLSDSLNAQASPSGFMAGVHDEKGLILARSTQAKELTGTIAPSFRRQAPIGPNQTVVGESAEGLPWMFTTRSLHTAPSWTAVVGMPLDRIGLMTHGRNRWVILGAIIILAMLVLVEAVLWLSRQADNTTRSTLDQLLEGVPAILYVNEVHPDGRFERRFLSRSAARVTGWPWQTLSRPGGLATLTTDEFLEGRLAFFKTALTQGTATFDYKIRHGDGTQHWMRSVARSLPRAEKQPGMIVGFITDVTEEYLVKDKVRQVQKFALLGEMASRIGHEISQPLAAISMAAENGAMALERAKPNIESVHEKFERISAQIDRVTALVRHIGTFSRKIKDTDIGPVELSSIIEGALSVSGPRCHGESVAIETHLPPEPLRVRGVGLLLEQVVVNLIGNACDAYQERPDSSPKRITIDAVRQDGKLILCVQDHAGGIPKDVIERVFEPFVTTKPPGKGTGLGLSISLATVTRFGGSLTVQNTGGGARFEVTLPIIENNEPKAEPAPNVSDALPVP